MAFPFRTSQNNAAVKTKRSKNQDCKLPFIAWGCIGCAPHSQVLQKRVFYSALLDKCPNSSIDKSYTRTCVKKMPPTFVAVTQVCIVGS